MAEDKSVSMFDSTLHLPTDGSLAGSLRKLAAAKAAVGGKPFMKLAKSGKWEFGPESIVILDEEKWAVNPASFMVGMIGWKGGTVVGEEMYPLSSEQRVDMKSLETIPPSKDGADGWKDQLTVDLRSMEDGTEGVYKTTALGGKNALADLAGKIGERMQEDESSQCNVPVCHLKVDSYMHKTKSYGRIFFPVFEIVEWIDDQGNKADKRRKLV